MKIKPYILCLLLFFLSLSYGQKDTKESIKVGLVLSGGGAKGLAHIGVLKVLDSLNIKVDYVGGTSMGAVIGGLYASGYSGKKLDSIFKVTDFNTIINDNIPRKYKTYHKKRNDEKYIVSLPFDKFELTLPSSISKGNNAYNLLSGLTLHTIGTKDFSDMYIPFFCVATNVANGKQEVLDQGNLAEAIAASSALPSLFSPIKIGDKMYIDGGIVNNYPVDEMKRKGVDFIIGVDVQDELLTNEEINSATDIIFQISNFSTALYMDRKAEKTDLYLQPDIKGYSVVDFEKGAELIKIGIDEALKNNNVLDRLPIRKSKPFKIKYKDSINVGKIEVKGVELNSKDFILGQLQFKENSKVSIYDFSSGVNSLLGSQDLKSLKYEFKESHIESKYDLTFSIQELKSIPQIKFSAHYDNLYKSSILVNFSKKKNLFKDDFLSIDFILGDNFRYNFDYFIDRGYHWNYGFSSTFTRFSRNIQFDFSNYLLSNKGGGPTKVETDFREFSNRFFIQTILTRNTFLRLGLEHDYLKISSETLTNNSNNPFVYENTDYLSTYGTLFYDRYDHKFFPKEGIRFKGDFHWYLAASKYNELFRPFSIAKANLGYAFKLNDNFSFELKTEGGFKFGNPSTKSMDFKLGGFGNDYVNNITSFYGYDYFGMLGDSFVKSEFNLYYNFFQRNYIMLNSNFANVGDGIFEKNSWLPPAEYSGYAFGYGLDSFFGPLQIKYSWSPDDKNNRYWFFSLGFWY